eukprot:GHVS01105361.1.p1 GENE.GHVS01105361.1~~GHVS01105361.1.p1  ORF type:complete len:104 (-),score=10.42 GHVS01105361.1:468-746(-)
MSLSTRRDTMEAEMATLSTFLSQPNYPGTSGPLVDKEGFPRADIDVHGVRTARHRLCCLKNDYEQIMEEIKKLIENVYSSKKGEEAGQNGNA